MPAPSPGQATFPFARCDTAALVAAEPVGLPPPPSWRTRLSLGRRAVVVSFAITRDGACVRVEAQHEAPGARAVALDVRLRPIVATTIQSDSPDRLHWALSPRGPGRDAREFFAFALRWGTRKLAGATIVRGRLHAVEAGLLPALRRAAADCAGVLAPGIRSAALRFAPPSRARIVAALARDRHGWLSQAARAHPGHVLFGLALFDAEETQEAGLTLLHDLTEGRRLGPALDAAIASWAAALPTWVFQDDLWHRSIRGAFAAAAELGGDDRARMISAHKLLVRRAGPWCAPEQLVLPPPVRFAPDDVPVSPRPNAAWFRVMKVPGVTVEARPIAPDRRLQEAFSTFASRHALALARPPRGVSLDLWLAELVEVLRASGRSPSRASDPARIVEQVDVDELRRRKPTPVAPLVTALAPPAPPERAPRPAPVHGVAPPAPPRPRVRSRPVPPPPSVTISRPLFGPWRSARASVVQITTLRELRAEGTRMHNCVADYRWKIESGDLFVFSARADGAPITIAIERSLGGWRLSEWKGFANRSVRMAEREALRPWLEAHRIGDCWGPR